MSSNNAENLPPITVLIPTYNYQDYIIEALESVLSSNYPKSLIEIIVVDDGSTDKTSDIIKPYLDRIKYIEQENKGKAAATIVGLREAKGKYIFTLDADDYFLHDRIIQAVNIYEDNPQIVHISHPAFYLDQESGEKRKENFDPELLGKEHEGLILLRKIFYENITVGAGSTFSSRASILKNLNITPEVDMFIDEFLLLHTLPHGNTFFIDECLSVWRLHGKNFSDTSTNRDGMTDKEKRTLSSMKAVSLSLEKQAFKEEFLSIYKLKLKAGELHIKERLGEKTFSDIFRLLTDVLSASTTLKLKLLSILSRYHIYKRFIPNSILRIVKRSKSELSQAR